MFSETSLQLNRLWKLGVLKSFFFLITFEIIINVNDIIITQFNQVGPYNINFIQAFYSYIEVSTLVY